mmetsp:Transcript_9480/g.19162  ORF Transcript_9480/g.19162 Transcript_9480/m.19162 type:complete len:275 (+) Transcript_9480:198-1022(+)
MRHKPPPLCYAYVAYAVRNVCECSCSRRLGLLLASVLLDDRLHGLLNHRVLQRGLSHLDDQRLDVLAVLGGTRERQPHLEDLVLFRRPAERLLLPRALHHEPQSVHLHELRLLYPGQPQIVVDHRNRRARVVTVHVAHDGLGEGLDRIDGRLHVVGWRDGACARKAADKVDGLEAMHPEVVKVAEVGPESVGVLGLVQLTQAVLLDLLVTDTLHVADESDASVGSACETLGGHAERGLSALGARALRSHEVLGMGRHRREAKHWQALRVERVAD